MIQLLDLVLGILFRTLEDCFLIEKEMDLRNDGIRMQYAMKLAECENAENCNIVRVIISNICLAKDSGASALKSKVQLIIIA